MNAGMMITASTTVDPSSYNDLLFSKVLFTSQLRLIELAFAVTLATIKLEHTRLTRSFSPRKLPAERTGHILYMSRKQSAQPATIIRTDWEATYDETILISLIELLLELHTEDERVACNG